MSDGWGDGWGPGDAGRPARHDQGPPRPAGDGWAEPVAAAAPAALTGPPVLVLVAGVGAAVVGLVAGGVALAQHGLWTGVLGWLLAGPVALGLLAAFVLLDGRRRASGWYVASPVIAWLRRALVAVALVAVVVCAWAIADVVARQ